MGNQVDEAKTKVRLNKDSLASDVDRLEDRVGYLTDVPAQVRRHWPKLVALGAIGIGVIAGLSWRKRHSHSAPVSDDEMAAQLQTLRAELEGAKQESMGKKVAMRAATAAATAVGTLVARRIADHLFAGHESEASAEDPGEYGLDVRHSVDHRGHKDDG